MPLKKKEEKYENYKERKQYFDIRQFYTLMDNEGYIFSNKYKEIRKESKQKIKEYRGYEKQSRKYVGNPKKVTRQGNQYINKNGDRVFKEEVYAVTMSNACKKGRRANRRLLAATGAIAVGALLF